MNLVFFGTPIFAKDILENLHRKHTILGVITQTDKPFGRKRILKSPETKQYALAHNIPCFQPQKTQEIPAILHNIHSQATPTDSPSINRAIEVIVVVAYGKILPRFVTDNYLCLNLHGSILPYFRGASPIQHSIMNDYLHFGLTVIAMNEGLDTGDILANKAIAKNEVEYQRIDSVFRILVPHGIELLESVFDSLQNGRLKPIAQNHTKATYCTKIHKQERILDLESAKMCYLRYLALCDKGVSIIYQHGVLKINEINGYEEDEEKLQESETDSLYKNSSCQKGVILDIDNKNARFSLSCTKGKLWISLLTPPNKPKMNALSFLQSQRLKVGDRLC
ncbi:methionyl-tRNA formyltransferase [Helicobacter sp. MIT 14-3879]|uniref:methionyl-tRNA formyltransferase n=1 Tax=Helicobacter sp. MIT 14-3879 TaxID=2040649 RepID=UPI000E1F8644|nr:methionyl-tRNA formyltransferase [Helicobacter sp. MIT 14-3879]RDU58871.1 methionyl-tRNA formyltransferase [Helicobacter sp. MIT 14-3879]